MNSTRTLVSLSLLLLVTSTSWSQQNPKLVLDTPGESAAFHALVVGGGAINKPIGEPLPPLAGALEAIGGNGGADNRGILTTPRKIKPGAIKKAIDRIREMRGEVAERFGAAPGAMALEAAAGKNRKVAGLPVGALPAERWAGGLETESRPLSLPLNALANISPDGWKAHGPHRVGGRIRSVIINPENPQEMLVGSVAGGIWFSPNAGATWAPVDDFMASVAVSCMVYHPGDPSIVFAGTGEGYGGGSEVQGAGLFISRDGGRSWNQLPATDTVDYQYVYRIAVAVEGAKLNMLVATETGIFRSDDEGASFTKVVGKTTPRRCLDVKIDPNDPTKCVGSSKSRFGSNDGQAFFSSDSGATWQFAQGISAGNRIELCFANANSNVVYAMLDKNLGMLFRSVNGGQTFNFLNVVGHLGHQVFGESGSQGWYNNCIWAGHPSNPNLVVVGGIDVHRSTNGGMHFTKITDWARNNGPIVQSRDEPHADNHVIVAHPNFNGGSNRAIYLGNDGGIFSTSDILSAQVGQGWTSLNNGLAISQFYGIGVNRNNGNIAGGLQDNGAVYFDASHPTDGWSWVEGGDGGFAAVDSDNDLYYGEYVNLELHRSNNGAPAVRINQTIQDGAFFIAPFILSPNDPKILYAGGTRLWKTNDASAPSPVFAPISNAVPNDGISAIAVQKGDENNIWLGYGNGIESPVMKSQPSGGGFMWVPVHANTLPRRWVTRIVISESDPNLVYVTFSGYEDNNLYRTEDGGTSWTEISNGLPEIPFRDLAIHPDDSSSLYLATEMGIFASEDGGGTWSPTNQGPTNAPVHQLRWMDRTLYAATHGRGVFSIDLKVDSGPTAVIPLMQPRAPAGGTVD